MKRQSLSAYIRVGKSEVKTNLEVYFFKENDVLIAYCPALNLSAYGDTIEEARSEFESILQEHLEWCIEHDTLEADLAQHGWRIKENDYTAPLATDMLMSNDELRQIVNHKDYQRIILPQMFHSQYAYA